MIFNVKDAAIFLLGIAAGVGATKYATMSDEEKEKLMNDLKEKANNFKDEAGNAAEKAKDFFHELKTKGGDALKEQYKEAQNTFNTIFSKGNKTEGDQTSAPAS
ncbi:MAG: YtxH domain-containing protein [Parafilimonas sp.]